MRGFTRVVWLVGAVMCIAAASVLLIWIGLPGRAEFTGYITTGGHYVAPEVNAYAPPFELVTLDGFPLNFETLHGFPIVINFWATWCEPCKVEIPALQAVYDMYKNRGLRIIAINVGETLEIARTWVEKLSMRFDVLLDPTASVAGLYQLRGQPSTFVVAPDGKISQIFYGPITQSALEAALATYFLSS